MRNQVFTILCLLLLNAFGFSTYAQQQISVEVSPSVTKYIKGHSELNRGKYFNLAANPLELNKNLDQEKFKRFTKDLEMTLGRKLFVVYSEARWGGGYKEDATRAGFMDTTYFKNKKNPNDNGLEEYMELWGENAGVAAHDGHNAYPDFMPKYTKDGSSEVYPENNDAAAEMAAFTLKYAYSDFQRPKYFELVNEPDWRFWSDQRFIDLHTKTHKKFKELNIPTEVGGPCFSVGYFYKNNYQSLKSIRNFIDATNFGLDFYSFHIYDYMKWDDAKNDFVGRVSTGLPEEGVFDAIAAYTFNKYGKEFTFVGSEHGGYVSDKTSLTFAENKMAAQYFPGSGFLHEMEKRSISNFVMVNSAIANTLTFMNHPHIVKKSVPFILLESSGWDPKYYSSLLVKENFDKNSKTWHEAKLVYFYEFFKDVRGRRVHSVCNDNDIQQLAFVDNDKLILVFHNQSNEHGNIDIKIKEWGHTLNQIKLRRLGRGVDFRPYLSEEVLNSTDNIKIGGQESLVVFATFNQNIQQHSEIEVTPFYSTEVGVEFGGTKEFTIEVPNPETVSAATLRIGLGLEARKNKEISVKLNGTSITMPVEDCAGRLTNENEYGSMRQVSINPQLLKVTNKVSVSFASGTTGGIGAVVIRAARLKSGIPLSSLDSKKSTIKMYPNPVSGNKLNFFLDEHIGEIDWQFYSLSGALIANGKDYNNKEFSINMTGLESGFYLLRVNTDTQNFTQKVLKL